MLAALAGQWRLMMFRAVLTLLLGLAALIWSPAGVQSFAAAFAVYALVNGALAILMAAASRREPGFAGLAIEGSAGVLVGMAALVPAVATPSALPVPIALWAIFTGIGAIWTAAALRTEMSGEWPLPFAGLLSVLFAILLLLRLDASVITLTRMLGWYAVLAGGSYTALALRMRQLAREITHA
jgi:uncharacterized membrane protein HdeD (DUF308 family)